MAKSVDHSHGVAVSGNFKGWNMCNIYIFGAKSLALGACMAIERLYPQYHVRGFVVSNLAGNPETLHGLPVMELTGVMEKETPVFIATPEDVQPKIVEYLEENGFHNYKCMDSRTEAELMGDYYASMDLFPGLAASDAPGNMHGYMAKFHKDRELTGKYTVPSWIQPLQVGAALTDKRVALKTDHLGDNISSKNVNYCELTALYWIWKNEMEKDPGPDSYYGLFHYRRLLDMKNEDLFHIQEKEIDAVLPYPTVCEPDISEHHERYVKAGDWEAMLQAVKELQPEYYAAFPRIFGQTYMYNYNIVFAKKNVLIDYCKWLFPILERTEELSVPRGSERADRYIGYLGENLLTLYFMYNKDRLRIRHTGKIMLV